MNPSDLELLTRYSRQGAEDAFTEIVRRHAGLVYAVALRVTRTRQLAEDVAQAVFLDLARNSKKLRPDTVLAAWLYSVTRGIATGTVAVTALLATHTAKAIPAGLAASICATVHSTIPLTTATLIKAATMTTLQKSIVGLTVVVAVTSVGVAVHKSNEVTQLREQLHTSPSSASETTTVEEHTGTTPVRTRSRASTSKSNSKLTIAQLEAKLMSLAKIGVDKFGRANMYQLIEDASVADIPRLLALVDKEMPDYLRKDFHDAWIKRWAAADPLAAFAYAAKIINIRIDPGSQNLLEASAPDLRKAALKTVLDIWTELDPAAARKAVADYADPSVSLDFATATLDKDYKGTMSWLMEQFPEPPNGRTGEIRSLGRKWRTKDPAEAWKWVSSLPDGNFKNHFIADMADAAADLDSPTNIANLVSKMPPGDDQNAAAMRVAAAWATTDPHAASEWAMQFPDARHRSLACRYIAQNWSRNDPAAARAWSMSLPAGEEQQEAFSGMTEALINDHPEKASEFAPLLTHPEYRYRRIKQVAESWSKRDPAAASQWLQRVGPSQEEIQKIQTNPWR